MFLIATFYFGHFFILCNRDYGTYSNELNNQMSQQILPVSILVTLTVFNRSVAIYSNDLTSTKNMTLKSIKT